ncbi:MAG TPA: undecaprenyl-phosphate glucose phosphotransferase [Steroidobacteraceae bacterium]|nr:undecaprenyl-phosphate glucose phosphotransferase [Steroidobacteraceae bacterium]
MTNPVVFKNTLPVGLLSLTQAVSLPILAGAFLVLDRWYLGLPFDTPFLLLLTLVLGLGAALLQPERALMMQLMGNRRQLIARIAARWMILLFALLAIGYATKSSGEFSRRMLLTWAVTTPGFLIGAALLMREALRQMLSDPASARRAIFVGYNEISVSLAQRVERTTSAALSVAGFFDDRAPERLGNAPAEKLAEKLKGGLKDIVRYVNQNRIDVIFVALPVSHLTRVQTLLDDLRDTTVSIYYVPMVLPFDSIQSGASEFLGVPVIALCETPFHGYRGVSKRLTDLILATAILIPALPVMGVVALLVKYSSPGPVLFKQRRYGLDGNEILVYKFRTMTVTEDGESVRQATSSDSRITPLGRHLRRYSLDELPQLFNVIQGRMSLVGPRPHAVAHNEEYRKLIKGYMVRHKVPPGITGLAQINGCRGETARVEEMRARVEYDLEYLRRWSPLLDLKILALTAVRLLRDEKAY